MLRLRSSCNSGSARRRRYAMPRKSRHRAHRYFSSQQSAWCCLPHIEWLYEPWCSLGIDPIACFQYFWQDNLGMLPVLHLNCKQLFCPCGRRIFQRCANRLPRVERGVLKIGRPIWCTWWTMGWQGLSIVNRQNQISE